jgi:hypothetical protein
MFGLAIPLVQRNEVIEQKLRQVKLPVLYQMEKIH